MPFLKMNQWQQFFIAQEAFLFVHLKKGHYLWSKYRFKLSPPDKNVTELFSVIVHMHYNTKQRNCKLHPVFLSIEFSSLVSSLRYDMTQ